MTLDLQRLRAMMEAATPGPWYGVGVHVRRSQEEDPLVSDQDIATIWTDNTGRAKEDTALIAALHEAAPALLRAAERADDLALLVKAANTFDGVQIDRGAFHLTTWTFLRKLYGFENGKSTGTFKHEAIACVVFEEDDVTPRLTPEIRAALADTATERT